MIKILHFIDFEVFHKLWTCVIINPIDKTHVEIANDREELRVYYEAHKDEIFVGFNIRKYDQYIFKALLAGFDPKKVNDFMIVKHQDGWRYSDIFRDIPLLFYDVMPQPPVSLKTLEGFMGSDIRETEIPFDYDGEFTPEMIARVLKYNRHDVEQTIEVFMRRKNEFDAVMSLIKTFKLGLHHVNKTKAQLSALILGCRKAEHNDEWDIQFVPCLDIKKYSYIVDWFKNPENRAYDKRLETTVCGIPHTFAWGGLHGAPAKPIHAKGLILHVDVTSFYPSIMIEWGMLTRNSTNPSKFKEIYDERVALKKAGKKKEQAPYKIVLNATYGICKDKFSSAYDPRQANNICVNGQLLLLDLLEHLEGHCKVLNVNTDGLIIQIPDTDEAFEIIDDICYEWETRTRMGLGLDVVHELWQKDVNNYLWIDEKGEIERKGAYVKELGDLDYDLPIVNRALINFMLKGIPVEDTVYREQRLKEFQKVVKISSKYYAGWHNGRVLTDKTFRVFASTCEMDTIIGKIKSPGASPEKFGVTPERCFIVNEDVNEMLVDDRLDKQWYINEAKVRLQRFGAEI